MEVKRNGKVAMLQTNLKALRESSGFPSVRKFEAATGINRAALSRWERGKELPFNDEIDQLEEVLGTRPTWFIEVEPPKRVLAKR